VEVWATRLEEYLWAFREERGSLHGGGRCWCLAGGGGATVGRERVHVGSSIVSHGEDLRRGKEGT
jgi:hypothetical protein